MVTQTLKENTKFQRYQDQGSKSFSKLVHQQPKVSNQVDHICIK